MPPKLQKAAVGTPKSQQWMDVLPFSIRRAAHRPLEVLGSLKLKLQPEAFRHHKRNEVTGNDQ